MKLSERLRLRIQQAAFVGLGLAERVRHGRSIGLFSRAFREDPHRIFAESRSRGPLFYLLAVRAWWVTSFELVREVLRDPRFSNDVRRFPKRAAEVRRRIGDDAFRLESFENPSMLNLDPPDHTRISRLATHAFTARYINSLEPRIRSLERYPELALAGEPSWVQILFSAVLMS